jgi:photosystem II stability/assembly factor-like uncharacterized protein
MTLTSRFGLRAVWIGILGAATLVACQGQVAVAAEPAPPPPPSPPSGSWVNVTGNVGGETWGPGGIGLLACVPGADVVIAGVSGAGLWSSADGGKTWTPLGAEDAAKITNRPTGILFDPKDPKTFWECGAVGPGIFKTTDSGKTFVRVGNRANIDALDVDFSDPERQTLLVVVHNQARGLWKSVDGGKTWKSLAKGLPEKIHPITGLAILDSKTYLVSTNGTTMGHTSGIFRSEDSGQTWKKVNAAGAVGRPLVASTGAIYWRLEGEGLSASGNKGWSWSPVKGKAQRTPIEAAGQRLISVDEAQLYGSPDRGATWVVCAPPAPYTPTSIAYSSQRNCFFICRSADKKSSEAIARFDLGQNLESVIPEKKAAMSNWEDATTGRALAWTGPADFIALASWAKFRGLDQRPATTGGP